MEKLKAVLNQIPSTFASKCKIFEYESGRWVEIVEGSVLEVFAYCLKTGMLQRNVCKIGSEVCEPGHLVKEYHIYLEPSDDQKTVLLNKLEGEIDILSH
jgi:hypothetical protein